MASVDVLATFNVTRNEVGVREAYRLLEQGWTAVDPETRARKDGGWDVLFLFVDAKLRAKRIVIATVEIEVKR